MKNFYIKFDFKTPENLVKMFKKIKKMLEDYYNLISKNNDITFQKMLDKHFPDLKYLKCLLKDKKEVFDLYVRCINDDYFSIDSLDEEKLRENVQDLFNVCCLDVDLYDSFGGEGGYKMYEKVVKIFEDFENSDTYKDINENNVFQKIGITIF